jgi:hypothetical protein
MPPKKRHPDHRISIPRVKLSLDSPGPQERSDGCCLKLAPKGAGGDFQIERVTKVHRSWEDGKGGDEHT